MSKISRRDFLKRGGAALGAAIAMPTIVPASVVSRKGKKGKAPSDKLNIAAIGVGGRGAGVLAELTDENIVALCDVDWKYAEGTFNKFPEAKRYKDFRVLYDEMGNQFDAVMCATADHTHAIISATAMEMGKHVYCEKPLTHTVYEARLLNKLAKKNRVATQMGNQGASGNGTATVCDWIWNGEIGEVTRVEAFTDRPIWPQGLNRPTDKHDVPSTLDWDLFIGPAQKRDYNPIYHPWNWRGWWDFGTGALGDMACHILQPAFAALKLGSPKNVQGSSTLLLTDCAPNAQALKYTFPARPNMPKVAFPEVEVYWYDGGIMPMRPANLQVGKNLNDSGGCVIFYGTKDTLICGCYGVNPYLLSGRTPNAPQQARRVTTSHQKDWVRACKEPADTRVEANSCFAVAGPLTEMVDMGVLAVRLQSLNQILDWDGENMRFTNIDPQAEIRICIKDGFSIHDGHPTFNKTWTEPMNALAFANELIKHTYHNGYELPAMPNV